MLVLIWSLLITLVQGQDSGNVFKPDPLTPGPWVKMSHGAIWPRPAQQSSWPNFFVLDPKSFKLQVGFTGIKFTYIYNVCQDFSFRRKPRPCKFR